MRESVKTFDLNLFADPRKVKDLVERYPGQSEQDYWKEVSKKKSDIVRKNMSMFYVWLYDYLEGGTINQKFKQKFIPNGNGHSTLYHPDVIHRPVNGRTDVEIKSFSTTFNGGTLCAVPQFENYLANLLKWADKDNYQHSKIGFDYAFFRYSSPLKTIKVRGRKYPKKVHGDNSFSSFGINDFIPFVGKNTRDLLIVPENLAILMMLNSNVYNLNQTSSQSTINEQVYFKIKSGDISLLHKPKLEELTDQQLRLGTREEKGIKALVDRYAREKLGMGQYKSYEEVLPLNGLHLDDLVARQYESHPLKVNGYKFSPFLVTSYDFKSPKARAAWINDLKRNHEELIVDGLKIRDLYQAGKEIPI